MSAKIILMRHGKPNFDFSRWITLDNFADFLHEYDTAEVIDKPPESALQLAQQCKVVVCSELLRSQVSANKLGRYDITLSSHLFNEVPLPYPKRGKLGLSILYWTVLLRIAWILGYANNGEARTIAQQRAHKAVQQLTELATKHGSVLVVGHGVMNRLIAQVLNKQGWQQITRVGSKHWSAGIYECPTNGQTSKQV